MSKYTTKPGSQRLLQVQIYIETQFFLLACYGGGKAKSTVCLGKHATFAPTNHQPPTPDNSNLSTSVITERLYIDVKKE